MEKVPSGKNGKRVYITNSFEETQNLAEGFAKEIADGATLCLYGELGSGKTTFVQGFARGLGIKQRIISPTFIIIRQYKVSPSRRNAFYHIDLYRIESPQDFEGLGLEEILNDSGNIVAIEWAERMGELLPKDRIDIEFEYADEGKRRITIR